MTNFFSFKVANSFGGGEIRSDSIAVVVGIVVGTKHIAALRILLMVVT